MSTELKDPQSVYNVLKRMTPKGFFLEVIEVETSFGPAIEVNLIRDDERVKVSRRFFQGSPHLKMWGFLSFWRQALKEMAESGS